MTDTEKLARAVQALREILAGSEVTGRWVDQNTYAAIDGYDDPDQVPDGYYDEVKEDPSFRYSTGKGEDEAGRLPALWEAYTAEEQDQWLETVADTARQALKEIEEADPCKMGIHSWADEVGKLPADTRCTRCGELYGDPF